MVEARFYGGPQDGGRRKIERITERYYFTTGFQHSLMPIMEDLQKSTTSPVRLHAYGLVANDGFVAAYVYRGISVDGTLPLTP